jgi:hypothetical protein
MIKIISRVFIIGLIIGGILYISSDLSNKDQVLENDKVIKNNQKEENLTFKIKKGKTDKQVFKKAIGNADKVQNPAKTMQTVVVNKKNVEKNKLTKNIKKFIDGKDSKELSVYLYEYQVNLSSHDVLEGNIVFRVINTGRLSHNLTLKDGEELVIFGKVAPGETKYFKANLSKSELEVVSGGRVDIANDMKSSLSVK